ncbi:hypothetical protein ELI_13760 [Erythrobacter litoralis HTCC2594]|uniref:Uncharacterized protein n=1 Tax=Erythrobacter litoralis (strain HTCC2594) TaxID=314225 RepID=Q2N647_ERYLH|nr:hypothetical protein ELI_13760 [Erythrobacter litoralis HTCC2594]
MKIPEQFCLVGIARHSQRRFDSSLLTCDGTMDRRLG